MQAGLVIVIICLAICAIVGVVVGGLSLYKFITLNKQIEEIDAKINDIDVDDLKAIQIQAGQLITDIRKQYLSNTQ